MISGIGLGLRTQHYSEFLRSKQPVSWLEILADNYLNTAGIPINKLLEITKDYPVVLHCVGMSIGSTDPLNWEYLQQVKELAEKLNPAWISDHLSWSSLNNQYSHDLLPLPFTQETIEHCAQRIQDIQNFLNYPLLIENVSAYSRTPYDEMDEVSFLNAIAQQGDCGILLDINNIYVNAHNFQHDPYQMINHVNVEYVKQYHLAGHTVQGDLLIDTHGTNVPDEVWALYQHALEKIGPRPACIEWDTDIPDFSVLLSEYNRAQTLHQKALM